MNLLLLSPAFPPNIVHFAVALARRGGNVLGIGDSPSHDHPHALHDALREYVWLPTLEEHEAVYRQVAGMIHRHGRIDRVESQIEHWLPLAARLRDDFRITGPSLATIERQRSKHGMAALFAAAGVAHIPDARATDLAAARDFARQHGYPLVLKPDTGAGAVATFAVHSDDELARAFESPRDGYLVQPFIQGDIVTFDGMTDLDGHIVFELMHRYDTGIMQVVHGGLDGYYYSRRDIPPALADAGRRAVKAFDVRGGFFHLEFFETADRGYVALEMNLRPPGGFTTDMMNYACDFDVYDLWARAMMGESLAGFEYERRYCVAHAGRRDANHYAVPDDQLRADLGTTLVHARRNPSQFAAMQGDVAYVMRHPDERVVLAGIERVQRRAGS